MVLAMKSVNVIGVIQSVFCTAKQSFIVSQIQVPGQIVSQIVINNNSYFHALLFSVFGGVNDITALYCKRSPRNFSPALIGYFFAEVSFVKGIGVVLVIPLLNKILEWTDLTIAITGAVVGIGFYIFLAFASNKWMMFVGEFSVCEVAFLRNFYLSCLS